MPEESATDHNKARATSTPYNELQLSSDLFDRPWGPADRKLILCSNPRTGSWLLCRAMIHHGLGIPHEYFNARHIGIIGQRYGIDGLEDGTQLGGNSNARRAYLDTLLTRRTVNGIFSAKIHWGQYASYLENPEGAELFEDAHFVHLYREDTLDQAISFHIALETGRWELDGTVGTEPTATQRFFDADLIANHIKGLAHADEQWRRFFSRNHIEPFSISYEGMRQDVSSVVRAIAGHFGLAVSDDSNYAEDGGASARDAMAPSRLDIKSRFLRARQPVEKPVGVEVERSAEGTDERVAAQPPTICLCMIVKNEAPVIRRCLESVRPLIDHWIIVDTGSTDGTQDIIREHMRDLPGELFERPWRDFAFNRSEALNLAREHADYSLIIDADDALEIPAGFKLPELTADSYLMDIHDAVINYQRIQLVRNALPWRYVGVLHEIVVCPGAKPSGHLPVVMRRNHDGARRRDPETFRRDARVLEAALANETDPGLITRYAFYLAQSYRDSGQPEKALEAYLRRAELGGWDQEVFISLYRAATLKEESGGDIEDVLALYQRATGAVSNRAEGLHSAARICRGRNEHERGYLFAKRGLAIQCPVDGLFVEPWIYDFGLLDEMAVCAYWTGRYAECEQACNRLLTEGKLPAAYRERVQTNRDLSVGKQREAEGASPPGDPARVANAASTWVPAAPMGGTEIIVTALRERLGAKLDRINLQVNEPAQDRRDPRPRVVWMHHNVDQAWVQWCKEGDLVGSVDRFIFVSYWQRERYLSAFGLPPERCVVLKHALEIGAERRHWDAGPVLRCAYVSTPFRGLSVLLDGWERLNPGNAELHIWSSMKLYGLDDTPYDHLYERAKALPGIIYRGIAPNVEVCAALRGMHFLVYPCTFEETACLGAIEAMAAGCRVIAPSLGALPETTAGYGRIYAASRDAEHHAKTFSRVLADELDSPWGGDFTLSLAQQAHCAATYSWPSRLAEWEHLIDTLCAVRP
jgi:LPS sulfotransferase NodH/glycosyltransferase involved in cell wall biosynthesis